MTTIDRRSLLAGSAALLLTGSRAAAATLWSDPAPRIPITPAGRELKWALAHINEGAAELSTRDLERHFAASFLAALPAEDLLEIFRGYLAPSGPMNVARFEGIPSETRIEAILITPGSDWRVTIGVDPDGAGINELFFEPIRLPATPSGTIKTTSDLERRLKRVAPRVSFQAGELTNSGFAEVLSVDPDRTLAVGSAFKLYVLAELARQIDAEEASWDEPLAVRDDLRSLPSGEMRLLPAGSEYPLRIWVEQMISVSDNTATDHLIARLGRERVEAAFAAFGQADPERNVPLLLTREWFAIKLRLSPTDVRRYLADDEDGKRALLAGRVSEEAATLSELEDWPGPTFIDSIEWFASAADLCRVTAALHLQAEREGFEPIHGALSINPGIAFPARTWAYVGYKGGYETGVKSDTWLLQRGDGRWFAMSAIINDPVKEIDAVQLAQLANVAADMLAKVE